MSSLPAPERTSHPFWMYDMIREIPESVKVTLERTAGHRLPPRKRVVFTGNGTAYYSAWMGSQVVEGLGTPCAATQSFELEHYGNVTKEDIVIGVSHSGITKSSVDSLRKARSQGAYTVGVTHFEERPIQQACDSTVVIGNGPDRSRCHTKTYVDSAAAVAVLGLTEVGLHEADTSSRQKGLSSVVEELRKVIAECEQWAKTLVDQRPPPSQVVFAAAGPNVVTAREAALKIKESCYLPSEGIELEEEMHGPWVDLDAGSLLVVISPPGPSVPRTMDLIRAARKIGATTVTVGERGLGPDFELGLPKVEEVLTPFLAIIPLYFVAYFLSVRLGHNPDYLRYLEPAYWDARQDIFPAGTH